MLEVGCGLASRNQYWKTQDSASMNCWPMGRFPKSGANATSPRMPLFWTVLEKRKQGSPMQSVP